MGRVITLTDELGASIVVGPTTPRTKLIEQSLQIKVALLYSDYATSLGIDPNAMDEALSTFIRRSSQIRSSVGLDFTPAVQTDSPQDIFAKFEIFLDTDHNRLLGQIAAVVSGLDTPAPLTQRPNAEGLEGNS